MTLMKTTGILLGLLMIGAFHIGCGEAPIGIDETGGFPTEKLSLEDATLLPEIAFEAEGLALEGYEIYANQRDGRDQGTVRERGDGTTAGTRNGGGDDRLRAILRQLQLSPRQAAAIEECFAAYRECIESVTTRARAARAGIYEDFHATVARIRNAAANGDITRDEARRLYAEAVRNYRAKLAPLTEAYHAARRQCHSDLIACIERVLTPEQLRRWRTLLNDRPDDGRDRPVDRDGDRPTDRDGDDNGDRDGDGDRPTDRDGDGDGDRDGDRDGDGNDGDRDGGDDDDDRRDPNNGRGT